MKKTNVYIVLSFVVVVVGSLFIFSNNKNDTEPTNISILRGLDAIIYKSPTCGCCVGYAAEARKIGINEKMIKTDDMKTIKEKYNISREMESCHTTVIGDYFIEGHVPFEAIEKLLAEKPDIDGIALPGMPSGTPGMPGFKTESYKIYQLKDGVYSHFVTI